MFAFTVIVFKGVLPLASLYGNGGLSSPPPPLRQTPPWHCPEGQAGRGTNQYSESRQSEQNAVLYT